MRWIVVVCLAAFVHHASQAGEAVTAFEPNKPPPAQVLANVPVKAVVAQFLDPDKSHLGKEIGYLIWREILTSVSDQRGAGVIMAHAPGEELLGDAQKARYHDAAIEIARSQEARMVLWGVVAEEADSVVLDSYVSLVGDVAREELTLRLNSSDRPGGKPNDTGFSAGLSRTRFNFPRIRITRQALFDRPLQVQTETPVYSEAGAGNVLMRAAVNSSLHADGMQGAWFRLLLPDGGHGWVDSKNVYVPPKQIDPIADEVLFETPEAAYGNGRKASAGANYPVSASKYFSKSGLWYRLSSDAGDGWVQAYRVRPHYSLPAVHFAAGLYRYQLGRYDLAAREFDQFTKLPASNDDPASLATGYELLSMSRLMEISRTRKAVSGTPMVNVIGPLQKAESTTPYDPGVYTLSAVAQIALTNSVEPALTELARALALDSDDPGARDVLARLLGVSTRRGRPLQEGMALRMTTGDQGHVEDLAARYKVMPK